MEQVSVDPDLSQFDRPLARRATSACTRGGPAARADRLGTVAARRSCSPVAQPRRRPRSSTPGRGRRAGTHTRCDGSAHSGILGSSRRPASRPDSAALRNLRCCCDRERLLTHRGCREGPGWPPRTLLHSRGLVGTADHRPHRRERHFFADMRRPPECPRPTVIFLRIKSAVHTRTASRSTRCHERAGSWAQADRPPAAKLVPIAQAVGGEPRPLLPICYQLHFREVPDNAEPHSRDSVFTVGDFQIIWNYAELLGELRNRCSTTELHRRSRCTTATAGISRRDAQSQGERFLRTSRSVALPFIRDCNNQARINGTCGACTDSSQCCPPLVCVNGGCVPLLQ